MRDREADRLRGIEMEKHRRVFVDVDRSGWATRHELLIHADLCADDAVA
jgi:hypothetical protein